MFPGEDTGGTIEDYNNWLKKQPNYDPLYQEQYYTKWNKVQFILIENEIPKPLITPEEQAEWFLDGLIDDK